MKDIKEGRGKDRKTSKDFRRRKRKSNNKRYDLKDRKKERRKVRRERGEGFLRKDEEEES